MTRFLSFARANLGLVTVCAGLIGLALWFAGHAVADAVYFNDPRNVDVDLKPWMTPRYVVLTYDLPRPLVIETLGLDPVADQGIRLGRLAQERDITLEELTETVRAAAALYREAGQ